MSGYDEHTCPGCDDTLRGVYATLFNARNRFGEPKMMLKLWDCKQFDSTRKPPSDDAHPAVKAMYAVYLNLMQAMEGVVQDGNTIRWVPGVMQRVVHLEPAWTDALVAYEEILDEHNRDNRHSRGEMNVLRGAQGSEHTLWGRRSDTGYDHFVRVADGVEPHQMRHKPCGQPIVIADHFVKQLHADPTFYGAAECPACRGSARPIAEFEINLGLDH